MSLKCPDTKNVVNSKAAGNYSYPKVEKIVRVSNRQVGYYLIIMSFLFD